VPHALGGCAGPRTDALRTGTWMEVVCLVEAPGASTWPVLIGGVVGVRVRRTDWCDLKSSKTALYPELTKPRLDRVGPGWGGAVSRRGYGPAIVGSEPLGRCCLVRQHSVRCLIECADPSNQSRTARRRGDVRRCELNSSPGCARCPARLRPCGIRCAVWRRFGTDPESLPEVRAATGVARRHRRWSQLVRATAEVDKT